MSERIDICNMALTWLGEKPITTIDDDLESARILKINYQPARDATLEAHEWSFAIKRFVPGKLEDVPEWGPENLFSIPSDIVRVLSVHDYSDHTMPSGREQAEWTLEENKILCEKEAIYCRGIKRITEEGRFSPLFVQALAAKLAMLIAVPLTASLESQQNMMGFYAGFIKEAKTRDGLQGRSKRIRSRRLQQVR